MSREAMDAVQRHSRFQGPDSDNYYPFRVLLAIAYYADVNGVAGVEGKYKECPSTYSIADRANISRTILSDKIATLEDSGELEIVASGGGGRGSWTVYRINLPIEQTPHREPIRQEMEHDQSGNATNTSEPLLGKMVQMMERMVHRMDHLEQLMVQQNSSNSSRSSTDPEPDTKETIETNRETKELPPDGGDELPETAQPYDVYQSLLGVEPGMKKGQSLREIKLLLEGDPSKNIDSYTPADIVGCAAFLQTDPWRIKNMVTLSTRHIMEKIDKWVNADRPRDWDEWQEMAESRASPNGSSDTQSRFLPKGHKAEAATGTDW